VLKPRPGASQLLSICALFVDQLEVLAAPRALIMASMRLRPRRDSGWKAHSTFSAG
jgi:hypothetical protein